MLDQVIQEREYQSQIDAWNGGVVVSVLWAPDFTKASGHVLGSISILDGWDVS